MIGTTIISRMVEDRTFFCRTSSSLTFTDGSLAQWLGTSLHKQRVIWFRSPQNTKPIWNIKVEQYCKEYKHFIVFFDLTYSLIFWSWNLELLLHLHVSFFHNLYRKAICPRFSCHPVLVIFSRLCPAESSRLLVVRRKSFSSKRHRRGWGERKRFIGRKSILRGGNKLSLLARDRRYCCTTRYLYILMDRARRDRLMAIERLHAAPRGKVRNRTSTPTLAARRL